VKHATVRTVSPCVPPGMPPLPGEIGGGSPPSGGGGFVGLPSRSLAPKTPDPSNAAGSAVSAARAFRNESSPAPPLPPEPAAGGLFDRFMQEAEEKGYNADKWENDSDEPLEAQTLRGEDGDVILDRSFTKAPALGQRGANGCLQKFFFDEGAHEQFMMTTNFDQTMSSPSAVSGSNRKWARGETIGRGTMGVVFQAMDQNSGQIIAVKEVAIDSTNSDDLVYKEQLLNEIRICKDLCHPRIVQYLGDDFIDNSLYIYLEYMAGGSMADVLKQFGAFEESLMAVYCKEILEGVEYLHTRDPPVVHRDIKSANVLVGLDARVKLTDFGCSKRQMDTMSHTMRGSIPWMAPEVIVNTGYGRKADIWSFGCVAIEMATAAAPWGKFDNPMVAMMKIGMSKDTPPVPSSISENAQDFIRSCVQRDKTLRPTASTLLQHSFVVDLLPED